MVWSSHGALWPWQPPDPSEPWITQEVIKGGGFCALVFSRGTSLRVTGKDWLCSTAAFPVPIPAVAVSSGFKTRLEAVSPLLRSPTAARGGCGDRCRQFLLPSRQPEPGFHNERIRLCILLFKRVVWCGQTQCLVLPAAWAALVQLAWSAPMNHNSTLSSGQNSNILAGGTTGTSILACCQSKETLIIRLWLNFLQFSYIFWACQPKWCNSFSQDLIHFFLSPCGRWWSIRAAWNTRFEPCLYRWW